MKRGEAAVLCGLTLLAILLRAWSLSDAGLTYTDEGVYAFSAYGLTHPAESLSWFPDIERFAPPLYPLLLAGAFAVLGPSDTAAILVNVLLGSLSVPLVWWVARTWTGHGLLAAALLTVSPMHVVLSRTAMTDVLFAALFLLSLALLARASAERQVGTIVLAGLVLTATCATKYHGPLALCVAALPVIARRNLKGLTSLGLAGMIAALLMLPWIWHITRQPGGFPDWLDYYRNYMTIPWISAARRQWENMLYLDRATLLLVPLAALYLWRGARSTGWWTLVTLLVTWLVIGPTYRPYFRLLLPMIFGLIIAAAAGWHVVHARYGAPAGMALLAGLAFLTLLSDARPWRPTNTYRLTASAIAARIPSGENVLMFGNTQLAFYLRLLERKEYEAPARRRVLDTLTTSRYVVWGPRERFAGWLNADGWRVATLSRHAGPPSELQLLDHSPPAVARSYRLAPDSTFDVALGRLVR